MRTRAELAALVGQRNFTPAHSEWTSIIAMLEDEALRTRAMQLLATHAPVTLVAAAVGDAKPRLAAVLVRVLGTIARSERMSSDRAGAGDALRALAETVTQPQVQRAVVVACGKAKLPWAAPWLIGLLPRATPELRRAIITALGDLDQAEAHAALRNMRAATSPNAPVDPEAQRRLSRARLMSERDVLRSVGGDAAPSDVTTTWLASCRPGLESLLAQELAALGLSDIRATKEAVACTGLLSRVWASRIALEAHVTLPLDGSDPLTAIVTALASTHARMVLGGTSESPTRLRLQLTGGPKRALIWQLAERLRTDAPWLVSDSRAAPFAVDVNWKQRTLRITPRRPSPRWPWRVADVPAASHPTVAAALAWVAKPTSDDVIWDPFVGSAVELIECGLRFPVRALYGTDINDAALAAARANVTASALTVPVTIDHGDARTYVPTNAPTLILSNPPWGGRVRGDAPTLLLAVLDHAARVLAPGGRLVWISPAHQKTRMSQALVLVGSTPIGGTGFDTVIEVWRRPP